MELNVERVRAHVTSCQQNLELSVIVFFLLNMSDINVLAFRNAEPSITLTQNLNHGTFCEAYAQSRESKQSRRKAGNRSPGNVLWEESERDFFSAIPQTRPAPNLYHLTGAQEILFCCTSSFHCYPWATLDTALTCPWGCARGKARKRKGKERKKWCS